MLLFTRLAGFNRGLTTLYSLLANTSSSRRSDVAPTIERRGLVRRGHRRSPALRRPLGLQLTSSPSTAVGSEAPREAAKSGLAIPMASSRDGATLMTMGEIRDCGG